MRNPLRHEDAAFRLVLYTLGYFALIVVAAFVHPAVGVLVFLGLTGAILYRVLGIRGKGAPPPIAPAPRPGGERRILVVADESLGGAELLDAIRERTRDVEGQVLVVCPARGSALQHWASDDDGAREGAGARLEAALERLRGEGISVRGEIGDGDPLQAIEDALRTFGPDEVVVSTHPAGGSSWLERGIVERARERFDVPISHVVATTHD